MALAPLPLTEGSAMVAPTRTLTLTRALTLTLTLTLALALALTLTVSSMRCTREVVRRSSASSPEA